MPDRCLPHSLWMCLLAFLMLGCDNARPPASSVEVSLQSAYSMRFSNDGQDLMVGSLHHGGSLWSVQPLERLYDWNHQSEDYSNILSSAFSPDGQYIATADHRTIVLWQRSTGEAVWYWNAPGNIKDIALTPKGTLALLAMDDYNATVFDIQNGGIRRQFKHDGIVYDVSLDKQGTTAASASDDLKVKIWDMKTGELIHTLLHDNQVRLAQLSADGRYVLTSAMGEPGKIWRLSSGKLVSEIKLTTGYYTAARFTGDNRQLITGNTSGQVELWDVNSGQRKQVWRARGRDPWVSSNVEVEDVVKSPSAEGWRAAGANGLLYELK